MSLGNGDGTFQTAVGYGTGDGQSAFTSGIALGDVNGDGIPDVALADPGNSNFSGDVALLLGNGDGTLQAAVRLSAGAAPYDVAIGDFNGDGLGDLVASSFTADTVSVLLNTSAPPAPADATPPAIVPTVTGTLGNGGWYTSDVHVSWSVTDPESTVSSTSGCDASDVTADTDAAGTTFTCTATSAGGSASQSVTVTRDATAPTGVATTLDRAPDANGWYTAPVGWTTTGADAGSGIASCSTGTYAGPDAAAASVAGSCTDVAGNTADAAPVPLRYDATPPDAVVTTLDRAPDANGWYDAPVGWTTTGTDAVSGIAACTSGTYSGPDTANASVAGSCTDAAGNSTDAAPVSFPYDATAPVTTATPDRPGGPGGWYTAPVTVTLTATDALSGVASTEYSLDGGPWTAYTDPVEVAGAGAHTLDYRSTDVAGNVETAGQLALGIDTVAPEAYLQFDPVTKDVLVYGRDTLSGVDSGPIAPVDVSGRGRGDDEDGLQTRTYAVSDLAGNTLTLVVQVRRAGHELQASVVSLSYDGGDATRPGPDTLAVEWGAGRDGILKTLRQTVTVGRERDRATLTARYDARRGETTLTPGRHRDRDTVQGLVLLRLATDGGSLQIEQ